MNLSAHFLVASPQELYTRLTASGAFKGALLGIDFGLKRIGLSMSDISFIIASPHTTYVRQTLEQDAFYLSQLIQKHRIIGVVCGAPLNLQGYIPIHMQRPIIALMNKLFAHLQNSTHDCLAFYTHDERFSTKIAIRSIKDSKISRKRSLHFDDQLAATYILQEVLDIMRSPHNDAP